MKLVGVPNHPGFRVDEVQSVEVQLLLNHLAAPATRRNTIMVRALDGREGRTSILPRAGGAEPAAGQQSLGSEVKRHLLKVAEEYDRLEKEAEKQK
jgi:hypothetical protein